MAARFPNRRGASAALDALQQRLRLADEDAAIAPMGTAGEAESGDQTLLAGHFPDEQSGLVRSLVARSGGEVVADVDEVWTRPRAESLTRVEDDDRRPFRRNRRATESVRLIVI